MARLLLRLAAFCALLLAAAAARATPDVVTDYASPPPDATTNTTTATPAKPDAARASPPPAVEAPPKEPTAPPPKPKPVASPPPQAPSEPASRPPQAADVTNAASKADVTNTTSVTKPTAEPTAKPAAATNTPETASSPPPVSAPPPASDAANTTGAGTPNATSAAPPANVSDAAATASPPAPLPYSQVGPGRNAATWLKVAPLLNTSRQVFSAAGLDEMLMDNNLTATLFVPTDDAWSAFLDAAQLTLDALLADTAIVTKLARNHIVPVVALRTLDMDAGTKLATLSQDTLTIRPAGDKVIVVAARSTVAIAVPDLIVGADNGRGGSGILDIVDGVLVPDSVRVDMIYG